MTLASLASARSDTVLKDLIVGEWYWDNCRHGKEFTYHPNGILNIDLEGSSVMRWDIKNGVLITTYLPGADKDKSPAETVSIILFLTNHELLLQDTKDKSYIFMSR